MDKRTTLPLIISLSFGILVLLWFAWSQFTTVKEENFRAAILKDLSKAVRTHDSVRAQTAVTKMNYELYQAAINRRTAEESEKATTAWTHSSEEECELEVLLRKQVATTKKRIRDRSGRLLPEWIRLHRDWQMIEEHLRTSDFYEPLDGCKEHYEKIRHAR
jgi:hypothetical protein